jgi:hypothetical protein
MKRKRSEPKETLPWYRQKNYKGRLSEHEKRILDSFRLQDQHPSASYDDLPTEVKHYINNLEHELHVSRTTALFYSCAFVSFLGCLMLYDWWKHPIEPSAWKLLPMPWNSLLLIVPPWIYWAYKERRLSRMYMPKDDPNAPTNEGLKKEWELEFISNYMLSQRRGEDD